MQALKCQACQDHINKHIANRYSSEICLVEGHNYNTCYLQLQKYVFKFQKRGWEFRGGMINIGQELTKEKVETISEGFPEIFPC